MVKMVEPLDAKFCAGHYSSVEDVLRCAGRGALPTPVRNRRHPGGKSFGSLRNRRPRNECRWLAEEGRALNITPRAILPRLIRFSCLMVLAAFLVVPFGHSFLVQAATVTGLGGSAPAAGTVHSEYGTKTGPELSKEEWVVGVEKTLQSIKATSEKDEMRGYYNKMVGRELIRHVRVIVIMLAIFAVAFPLAIWLMSRKRVLGLSGLSAEVAATLLVIEERQAKLANTLKRNPRRD